MEAAFLDDRSRIDLALYKSGDYIIFSNWMFGEERFQGTYQIVNDTIIFNDHPVVDNDFVARKILIDKEKKRIYFTKDKNGNYKKDFYYFQIDF